MKAQTKSKSQDYRSKYLGKTVLMVTCRTKLLEQPPNLGNPKSIQDTKYLKTCPFDHFSVLLLHEIMLGEDPSTKKKRISFRATTK